MPPQPGQMEPISHPGRFMDRYYRRSHMNSAKSLGLLLAGVLALAGSNSSIN